jgi:hypothetical protein
MHLCVFQVLDGGPENGKSFIYKGQETEQHTATQKSGIQPGNLRFKVTNSYTCFMNTAVVLYLKPRRLVNVYLHFRGTHCIRHYS